MQHFVPSGGAWHRQDRDGRAAQHLFRGRAEHRVPDQSLPVRRKDDPIVPLPSLQDARHGAAAGRLGAAAAADPRRQPVEQERQPKPDIAGALGIAGHVKDRQARAERVGRDGRVR
jgi:hypothetical protein